jgi:acetyl esterase/lipase
MGSNYFYLEFLLAWLTLLLSSGYRNPAIFAVEYTLVPNGCYPTQLQQVISGYDHVLSQCNNNSSNICVSGDSAGATLILSLLLHLGKAGTERKRLLPGLAILISPWVTLISQKDHNTRSDYLDTKSLHLYARQYAGSKSNVSDPLISPGNCTDLSWLRASSPLKGFGIFFGAEEVFAPEIRDLISRLEKAAVTVVVDEEEGGIHAWPVVCLFLSSSRDERQKGLRRIVKIIRENMK